jgi:hypothetical protein
LDADASNSGRCSINCSIIWKIGKNFKTSIISYDFMFRRLHRAQLFWISLINISTATRFSDLTRHFHWVNVSIYQEQMMYATMRIRLEALNATLWSL